MTAIELRGVHFFVGDRDATLYYVPGEPSPERDPQGRPTLMLVGSERGALLQLGARWMLDEAAKAQLLPELQARLRQNAALLTTADLQPAPVSVAAVTLSLSDGAGGFTALGTNPSSGFPPYTAIFSATLDADQKGLAVAAIRGRAELLKVEYRVALPPEVAATFAGAPAEVVRATDVGSWFTDGSWQSHFLLTGASI